MIQIILIQNGESRSVSAQRGMLLSDVLRREIPAFALPCGGHHTCGKCRVQVSGPVSPPTAEEVALLGPGAVAGGQRLACACRAQGDVSVTVETRPESRVLTRYQTVPFEKTERGYGFAVDIGTTTVVVQLIHRPSGAVAAERTAENAQRGFGADVISRIEACRTAGSETLSRRITQQLEELADACLAEAGVRAVEESVVTGNTTMLHLYEGLDPSPLAAAPFSVPSHFGTRSRRTLAGSPVYLPRCVGAYVGADILCAVTAAGLTGGGIRLLADIGTNGELVLARGEELLCCSTAAGPAFEGAGLRQGMTAAPGAIRAVGLAGGRVTYHTVSNAPAIGICGSGAIDALSVMGQTGAMDETGYLESEVWPVGNSGISITQHDVRQLQLAKAAVCAGIRTLLQEANLSADAVQRFVIAGGFGSSMDLDAAAAIGLFPASLRPRAAFTGNGALGGAAMLLMNSALREKTERLGRSARELSLPLSPVFMEHYLDAMTIGPMA